MLARVILTIACILLLSGCAELRYVTQASAGQEDINRRGIAIDEVVDQGLLDRRTRELLAHVPRIKAFGERHGLKKTKNYERYVWLGRDAVVWVVTASSPLAFRPKVWSFPIVGSFTYEGWFDKNEARTYAASLEAVGWDVDVRPSQAYSTLGWFDDPILSTMIVKSQDAVGSLADVVLHETLHATFYVRGQSTLNESVASFFGDRLAVVYLDEALGPDSIEKRDFVAKRERSERKAQRMHDAYVALEHLYASHRPSQEVLAEKARITQALRAELRLERPVNNASLIQYKTYGSGKAELDQLLCACDGDFPRLLRHLDRVRESAKAAPPHSDPAALLQPLLRETCSP